jgi:hypothetical protein
MKTCGFRPKSFADSEAGCPLDHCQYCGQHDHEDAPCAEMRVSKQHQEWKQRVLTAAFDKWADGYADRHDAPSDPAGATAFARAAFMFAVEQFQHEMNEYTMEDCGQEKCHECHGFEEDPMGSPESYR